MQNLVLQRFLGIVFVRFSVFGLLLAEILQSLLSWLRLWLESCVRCLLALAFVVLPSCHGS